MTAFDVYFLPESFVVYAATDNDCLHVLYLVASA